MKRDTFIISEILHLSVNNARKYYLRTNFQYHQQATDVKCAYDTCNSGLCLIIGFFRGQLSKWLLKFPLHNDYIANYCPNRLHRILALPRFNSAKNVHYFSSEFLEFSRSINYTVTHHVCNASIWHWSRTVAYKSVIRGGQPHFQLKIV